MSGHVYWTARDGAEERAIGSRSFCIDEPLTSVLFPHSPPRAFLRGSLHDIPATTRHTLDFGYPPSSPQRKSARTSQRRRATGRDSE